MQPDTGNRPSNRFFDVKLEKMHTPPFYEALCHDIDRLLATSPELARPWDSEWGAQDERNPYVEAGIIARYFADLVETEPQSPEVKVVSDAIESAFASGVDGNWLQVGLIESMQNSISNDHDTGRRTITAGEVKARLGPLAQASWDALDRSWGNSVNDL
jgi:hypothetical protein